MVRNAGGRSARWIAALAGLTAVIAVSPGCSRKAETSTAANRAGAGEVGLAAAATATQSNTGAQSSEFVASNKPEPGCRDCGRGDATNGPKYVGNPEVKLDEAMLDEVKASIDQTSGLLEQGIEILERNAKSPDKAAAELEKFLQDHDAAIRESQSKAAEIKARLRAVGYDQDIPAEIRPGFEERMSKISERLERVREVYASRRDVLGAFGRLFPRGR
jgi:hypothetical protein